MSRVAAASFRPYTVQRREPCFICRALVTREQAWNAEAEELPTRTFPALWFIAALRLLPKGFKDAGHAELRSSLPSGTHFSDNQLEERLWSVMKIKKKSAVAAGAVLLVIAATLSFIIAERQVGDRSLWSETAAFSELAPGAEVAFADFVSVTKDTSEVQYVLSYGSSGMCVEFGLRAADGTEYAVSASGGGGSGTIGAVPVGSYELFVRNVSSYPQSVTGAVGISLNG